MEKSDAIERRLVIVEGIMGSGKSNAEPSFLECGNLLLLSHRLLAKSQASAVSCTLEQKRRQVAALQISRCTTLKEFFSSQLVGLEPETNFKREIALTSCGLLQLQKHARSKCVEFAPLLKTPGTTFMLFLRSVFFMLLQPGTVAVLIPYWLISSRGTGVLSSHQPFRYLGLPLILIGATVLLWCIWEFFSKGRGTISPIDPPKHLVVRGLYRYVRNPIYVAVVTILIGEAIFFKSVPVLIEAGVFVVLANLFVLGYEERALRRQFGESYERYTQTVGRWIPQFRSRAT